jgi:catechol 2,3-dioxygenase-like lactoylglutathione lyase family enzyme
MSLTGVDHVAFTVSDLDRTTAWYCEHFGFEPLTRYTNAQIGAEVQVLQHPEVPLRLSFRRFDGGSTEPFSELRVGLDHLALGVTDTAELAHRKHRLEQAGITCHRTDLPELSILVLRDPDNIQIELCTPLTRIP